ncbi:PREDICTED: protein DBF4 homolog A isoform X1 [Poecilia mexicana]|uniref:Protein DBF4 homolog A n=1 Tax=Poecilia mexicana TaxID=48701 RepID=A0A3B3X031_9TELE|nr:PREDICTED: protein DBF4 homolog A isoform X1 [Poecilia mexicana]XP_014839974.1 PREDICTED: protein DBF4 homolog A isoform X1 [Poecilia mexicana]XP_014839975.1 PREDICTED: protein DBF4 homolog A isoform X1 [Poecilia mexicana]
MKPKHSQNHHRRNPGSNLQGKSVNAGEKTSVSKAKQTSNVSSSSQVKPFAGKVFYLDLQSNRTAETLESDIKQLGGIVEKFFSKEIKYLVSNKREAKHVHCLRQDSPVPSPDSGQSSPQPHSNPHCPPNRMDKTKSQGQVDSLIKSRGKSLVERVVTGQGRLQMDRILSNALEWGVKILYLDDVLAYVQKKKKIFGSPVSAAAPVKSHVKNESSTKLGFQKYKAGRITKPFIKIEDSSRHYRPIYLSMPNLPEFSLKTAAPCSPFCVEEKNPSGLKQHGHRGVKTLGAEEKGQGRKKNREKKRGGYCECCLVKYDQLKMHLQSERHKAFSRSDEYLIVDQQVSTLHFNFLPIKTKDMRRKCSVSSVLVAPGPCGEAGQNLQGDASHSDTVKAEEDWIVDASEESNSEHFCTKGGRKNCYTYSDKSKHRFLASKRTIRQNSSTQKSEQIMIPLPKSENPHSDGAFLTTFPSRDKISHKDTNSSVSYLRGTNLQSEASASNFSVVTHGAEETNKDAALSEAKTFSKTENSLSEKEEENPNLPIFCTVQKIQRKIKAYKHKRRKVDPSGQPAEPENSLLKLWEIFKSSDNMDVEFLGFSD